VLESVTASVRHQVFETVVFVCWPHSGLSTNFHRSPESNNSMFNHRFVCPWKTVSRNCHYC
jgi:hypothetical protein